MRLITSISGPRTNSAHDNFNLLDMNTSQSPASRVFETPELLAKILDNCHDGYLIDYNDDDYRDLIKPTPLRRLGLRLVNRLWLNEASRVIFKSCNDETIAYLKKLCNDRLADYGPMIRHVSLGQIFRFNNFRSSLLIEGAPFNLENLKTLEFSCGGASEGIAKVFGMCTKLETVKLKWIETHEAVEWLHPLLQIAPKAEYHIHVTLYVVDQEFDEFFQLLSDNHNARFLLDCEYLLDHTELGPVGLRSLCQAFAKYPSAGRTITQFDFSVDGELLIQTAKDVFFLFEIISANLEVVQVRITNIDGQDRHFVQKYLVPILQKCKCARKMDIYLENDSAGCTVNAQVQEIEDEWRKQVVQCTPGLESLVFKVAVVVE